MLTEEIKDRIREVIVEQPLNTVMTHVTVNRGVVSLHLATRYTSEILVTVGQVGLGHPSSQTALKQLWDETDRYILEIENDSRRKDSDGRTDQRDT